MKRIALAFVFGLFAVPAFAACPSPLTGKDAAGTTQNFGVTIDGSGNCYGNVALVDGTAAANKLGINSSGQAAIQAPPSLPLPTGGSTSANQTSQITQETSTATNTGTIATNTGTANTNLGAPGATVCSTDTGSCSLNALLQRIASRISSLITALGTPFQAGGSIGNTSFGAATSPVTTNPTSTLTLPATTTAYTAGQLIASSATAGSVVNPSFAIANSGGGASIPRLRLSTNDTTSTAWGNQTIQVDLWTTTPTWTNGDRGTWSPATGTGGHLGAYTCVTSAEYGDGAYAECYPAVGNASLVKLASGTSVFWSLQAVTGSGVTGGSKVFTLAAELQN